MMNGDIDVRVATYGGLMVSSYQIKMIRENLEMQQYLKNKQDQHELELLLMNGLCANRSSAPILLTILQSVVLTTELLIIIYLMN